MFLGSYMCHHENGMLSPLCTRNTSIPVGKAHQALVTALNHVRYGYYRPESNHQWFPTYSHCLGCDVICAIPNVW